MDFRARQKNLTHRLAASKLDGLLVTHLPNIQYLCGFTGSSGLLLVEDTGNVFFTDSRYDTQAHAQVVGAKVVISKANVLAAFADRAGKRRHGKPLRLGIESGHMTVDDRERLRGLLPASFKLKNAPPIVEQLRLVKDADELQLIRSAVRLGATLFDTARKSIQPGVKEVAVAAQMEYAARLAGAEAMSFPTIIASGAHSALPHGRASEGAISRDSFVVCDWGVILSGYCSDQTRSVWVGKPDNEAQAAYKAVLEAQLAAVDAVRPGATVGEVDSAARKVLRKAGWGRYFTHSTGHGVGIEIHEAPRVAAGQTQQLTSGMVITIEPGVYIPGTWGIRIEDMVAVTDSGCEVLTPTSKELVAL